MNRKAFVAGLVALVPTRALAQVQTVGNQGQIVSTGDVWVDQNAAGNQVVYDVHGRIVATQAVGNDLQIVSTGDVHAGQRAAGSQEVSGQSYGCTPGDYGSGGNGCLAFCDCNGEWQTFCCQSQKRCRTC